VATHRKATVKGKRVTVKGVLNPPLTAKTLTNSEFQGGVKPVKGKSSTAQKSVRSSIYKLPQIEPLGKLPLTPLTVSQNANLARVLAVKGVLDNL